MGKVNKTRIQIIKSTIIYNLNANLVRLLLASKRETNKPNVDVKEDTLNQSTENDDDIELEELGKTARDTHVPSEGTQLQMATWEDSNASRDPEETGLNEESKVEAEFDASKPEALVTPSTRTVDDSEEAPDTHLCQKGDLVV